MTPSKQDLIEETLFLFLILIVVCLGIGVLLSVYVF
jgi:hypothetical protein